MNPKHYVSLELAKKLKKAGYKQEGMVWWGKPNFSGEPDYELFLNVNPSLILHRGITLQTKRIKVNIEQFDTYDFRDYMVKSSCVAPSVAELGEVLPPQIEVKPGGRWITCTKNLKNIWEVGYAVSGAGFVDGHMSDETEADARAKMWLWLREKKFL